MVCMLVGCSTYSPSQQTDFKTQVAFKRYLFTSDLVNETEAADGFKKTLETEEWKSVCATFREFGARDLEIYVFQDRLLSILETDIDFDLEQLDTALGMSAAYSKWQYKSS